MKFKKIHQKIIYNYKFNIGEIILTDIYIPEYCKNGVERRYGKIMGLPTEISNYRYSIEVAPFFRLKYREEDHLIKIPQEIAKIYYNIQLEKFQQKYFAIQLEN